MRLAWEILVYLRLQSGIHPVGWMREFYHRASRRGRLFWYSVSLLMPNRHGSSRWYRCRACGRLCNSYATPGGIWAEETPEGAKLTGECGRCRKETEKENAQ